MSGWVNTEVAASALGVAPRTIRDYIRRGELDAITEGEGVKLTYLVSIDSIHDLRNRRSRDSSRHPRGDVAADIENHRGEVAAAPRQLPAAKSAPEADRLIADLLMRLEDRSTEAGDLRARLEITEKAESTLKDDLDRERTRADELEKKLEAERGRSWWRRLTGR